MFFFKMFRKRDRSYRPRSALSGRSLEVLEVRRVLHAAESITSLPAEGEGNQVPDFALIDVNSSSLSYQQSISPRDYLEQVSAWYFGHAS